MTNAEERQSAFIKAVRDVSEEVQKAMRNWPEFNSAHEAYGVLTEEYRELEKEVFLNQKKRELDKMRKEAVQVAAMAIRFIVDVCNEETIRK